MAMELILRDTSDRRLAFAGWSINIVPGDVASLCDASGKTRAMIHWPTEPFKPPILDKLAATLPASEWRWLSTR